MKRIDVTGKNDTRIFNATARRTKKINIQPKNMRGGIRL